eukprot:970872-Prorocentrum_minimum.AAC.1
MKGSTDGSHLGTQLPVVLEELLLRRGGGAVQAGHRVPVCAPAASQPSQPVHQSTVGFNPSIRQSAGQSRGLGDFATPREKNARHRRETLRARKGRGLLVPRGEGSRVVVTRGVETGAHRLNGRVEPLPRPTRRSSKRSLMRWEVEEKPSLKLSSSLSVSLTSLISHEVMSFRRRTSDAARSDSVRMPIKGVLQGWGAEGRGEERGKAHSDSVRMPIRDQSQ